MNDEYLPLTYDEVSQALLFIPADNRDTWLNIGNALKTEFDDAGWALWDHWSQQGATYNAATARQTWKSLKPGKVSIRYLDKTARNAGWERKRQEMSAEDKRRFKAEQDERRRQRQAQIEADAAQREAMQAAIAQACREVCERYTKAVGPSEYLGRKRVGAHGLLFPRCSVLIGIDDQAQRVDVWAGEEVSRYFADLPKPRPEHISFMLIKRGSIVLPLRDAVGAVWSLQVIQPNGTKLFPKYGRKSGLWHLLGETVEAPVVAIAEGYATAASIHEAMGWPVAVALDAGNLQRVAGYLRLLYPDSQMVVCGDDDPEVTNNPGRLKAQEAANTVGGVAVFPRLGEVA